MATATVASRQLLSPVRYRQGLAEWAGQTLIGRRSGFSLSDKQPQPGKNKQTTKKKQTNTIYKYMRVCLCILSGR